MDRDRENARERERDRDREREQRERERERERDGDRGRDRERERERDRDRDRERERDQDREVEIDSRRNTVQPLVKTVVEEPSSSSEEELDKEEEQRRLEQEMIKRRERIERWRAERKLKELEINKKDLKSLPIPIPSSTTKKWSLEDESEEEDNNGNQAVLATDIKKEPDSPPAKFQRLKKLQEDDEDENEEKPKIKKLSKLDDDENDDDDKANKKEVDENDDIDPLDAYMQEVDKEVRNVNHIVTQPKKQQGVVILTGVAKKSTEKANKGELIEQNMDSLEYSSEEELEDIKDTAANLANKHRKELAKIDHSGVNYASFRKNFYVEVPELARMSQQEVDKYRADLEGIQVKGKGCPKPIKVKIFNTKFIYSQNINLSYKLS